LQQAGEQEREDAGEEDAVEGARAADRGDWSAKPVNLP
jgi:hypothetical protein